MKNLILCMCVLIASAITVGANAATFAYPAANHALVEHDCGYGLGNPCARRNEPEDWSHAGVDYEESANLNIYASHQGKVVRKQGFSSDTSGLGNNIIIQHYLGLDAQAYVYSSYSHLDTMESNIEVGSCVSKGQVIGVMGRSGAGNRYYYAANNRHLHFEFRSDDNFRRQPVITKWVAYTIGNPSFDGNNYLDPTNYIEKKEAQPHPECPPIQIEDFGVKSGPLYASDKSGVNNFDAQYKIRNLTGSTIQIYSALIGVVNKSSGASFVCGSELFGETDPYSISPTGIQLCEIWYAGDYEAQAWVNAEGSNILTQMAKVDFTVLPKRYKPAAPISVSASHAAFSDKIQISRYNNPITSSSNAKLLSVGSEAISASMSATTQSNTFEIYRCTSDSVNSCSLIYSGSNLILNDTSATLNTDYYYRVKACNSEGCSGYSGYSIGKRVSAVVLPQAPNNLTASNGSYSNKVSLDWSVINNSSQYAAYRCTSTSTSSCGQIYSGEDNSYQDVAGAEGINYYYRVKACNQAGCSSYSSYELGKKSIAVLVPSIPSRPSVSKGVYQDRIDTDWHNTAGAVSYLGYRCTSASTSSCAEVYSGGLSEYSDILTSSSTFYYRVKACNSSGCSGYSDYETGYVNTSTTLYQQIRNGFGINLQIFNGLNSNSSFGHAFGKTITVFPRLLNVGCTFGDIKLHFGRVGAPHGSAGEIIISENPCAMTGNAFPFTIPSTIAPGNNYNFCLSYWHRPGTIYADYYSVCTGAITVGPAPVAHSPANGSSNVSITPTLSFSSNSADTPLIVLAREKPNSSNISCSIDESDKNGIYKKVVPPGTSEITVPEGILNYSSDYEWIVQSYQNGKCINSTTFFSFTTEVSPPPVPASPSILASDGSSSEYVRLNWGDITYATSYSLYKCTSISSATCELIQQIESPSTNLFDYSLSEPGVTEYYRAKACNSEGCSDFSSYNPGYKAISIPTAPSGLIASDGEYLNQIKLSWYYIEHATSYRAYRCSTVSTGTCSQIYSGTSPSYDNDSLSADSSYYYRVKACNSAGCSAYSTQVVGSTDADSDGDNISDATDNCPFIPNVSQVNTDGDGEGDACDNDDDNDAWDDGADNCPLTPNPSQDNNDNDSLGDACDLDDDNDTIADTEDNCQFNTNTNQANFDGDDLGDICDSDDDNDGMPDQWEIEHGLNPRDASDADADNDGDGRSNLQEYLFGSDPNVFDERSDLVISPIISFLLADIIAPVDVTASDGADQEAVTISWQAIVNATKYKIYRYVSVLDAWILIGETVDLSFQDSPPLNARSYFYSISACDSAGCSNRSEPEEGYRAIDSDVLAAFMPLVIQLLTPRDSDKDGIVDPIR